MRNLLKFISLSALSIFVIFIIFAVLTIVGKVSIETLEEAIFSKEIQFAIKLSLMTASIATLIGAIVGIPSAYALARYNFKGKELIDSLVDLPVILPPLISGFALLVFFGNTLIGGIAESIINIIFSPIGIIVAQFFVATPFIIKTSKAVFEGIDEKYEYIAQSLGISRLKSFFKVILPMAKNGILAGMILAWARSIGEFGATLMLAGATKMKTETLPIAVFLNISVGKLELALSVAFIFLVVAVLIIFSIKTIVKIGDNYEP
ncbi:ABC transporter permease [Methanothermococcus okinawensis]|uniref:NifC-like ABC-type porter n=1 Tax=Methanothermococcus okinawensis (strain DSM 14208 / JCM 11175 / IH1) TaxID=647113 RepID=F8ALW0_METOI|nr:ABC transporter permease [Methanothermococcus okinawensis]AEH07520.1 NifC-like ABC-type porter [Methanothermococcus okinawensis IH1]